MTAAVYKSSGTSPDANELVNIMDSGSATAAAQDLSSMGWIPSGHADLSLFNLWSFAVTSGMLNFGVELCHSDIFGVS